MAKTSSKELNPLEIYAEDYTNPLIQNVNFPRVIELFKRNLSDQDKTIVLN